MTYGAIQAVRDLPQPWPASEAEWAQPPAPRQDVAYRCTAGHEFAVTFAAEITLPAAWDCRCGSPAALGHPAAAQTAPRPRDGRAAVEESNSERHHRFIHERRTVAELEELLAERLALLPGRAVRWLGMTREEWAEILGTAPATQRQIGAIHAEFARLGFTASDRRERLAATVALLGLDGLWSTRDLVMGEAGRLVGMLRRISDREGLDAALTAAAAAASEPEATAEHVMTLAEALAIAVRTLVESWSQGVPVLAGNTENDACGKLAAELQRTPRAMVA